MGCIIMRTVSNEHARFREHSAHVMLVQTVKIKCASLVNAHILYFHISLCKSNFNSFHVCVERNNSAQASFSDVRLILGGR